MSMYSPDAVAARVRLLRWQHPGAMPGRHAFENICTALEPYATQARTRWAASCAILRPGKVDTALGPREAGRPIGCALPCHACTIIQTCLACACRGLS